MKWSKACYDVPSTATGTEYMLHGSCYWSYWSSLIINDSCCPSLPSPPRSEIWPQHTACTKPPGLLSSCMDILTTNDTIQLSRAGTQFSLPNAKHRTADIMRSLGGKRQKLQLRSIILFPYGQNPTSDPSGGSPGTWPHPQCGTSSPDSSWGCRPGAWEVPGPWFACPPSPASRMALWSSLCPRKRCHDASRICFLYFLQQSISHLSFEAQLPELTVPVIPDLIGTKHIPHSDLDAVGFIYENLHIFLCEDLLSICLTNSLSNGEDYVS